MRVLFSPLRDGACNLALEEHLFASGEDALLFWISDPCVVIGRNQNAFGEADLAYCRRHAVPLYRRITGGGAVYHDGGNLNCSRMTAAEGPISYAPFLDPLVEGLHTLSVDAVRRGESDVYLSGAKLCGTAQTLSKGRVLTHATLLCRTDLGALTAALSPGKFRPQGGGVASRRASVTNCGLDPEEAARGLARAMGGELSVPTEEELAAARRLADEKYRTYAWNFSRSPRFSVALPELQMEVEQGVITRCSLPALVGHRPIPEDLPHSVLMLLYELS